MESKTIGRPSMAPEDKKKKVKISIDVDLWDFAKEHGVSVSAFLNEAGIRYRKSIKAEIYRKAKQ